MTNVLFSFMAEIVVQNIGIIRFLHYFVTDKLMLTALDYFTDIITISVEENIIL